MSQVKKIISSQSEYIGFIFVSAVLLCATSYLIMYVPLLSVIITKDFFSINLEWLLLLLLLLLSIYFLLTLK